MSSYLQQLEEAVDEKNEARDNAREMLAHRERECLKAYDALYAERKKQQREKAGE